MVSKKGITITIIILIIITGVSFLAWTIPQENPSTNVISDYENYLDRVKNIHGVLQETIDIEFQNLLDRNISVEEYITITEITSSQVTAEITEFIKSKPPEEWQDSYINYMDALKNFNSYIIETKIVANMINEGSVDVNTTEKIEFLKEKSLEYIKISDETRPN